MVSRNCLTVVAVLKLREGVVQATAAQLLQVLGKACPFSGPGLLTVRRDELPAGAWGRLCRPVGGAVVATE